MAEVNIIVNGKDETGPAREGINAMEKGVKALEFACEALGVAVSAIALAELGKEAILAAAKYESLGVTMEVLGNTAGYTKEQMDGFEESLAKAGILGVEARQNLALMAENHVDLSRAAELSTIAQNAAAVAGISVSEAFQRIAFSVDTGNARTLRAMGITINYTKAYQDLARELGKNTDELSDYEKVRARVEALEKKGPDIEGAYQASLGTTAGQIGEIKKEWEQFLEIIGSTALPGLLVILENMVGGIKNVNSASEDLNRKGELKAWGREAALGIAIVADAIRYVVISAQSLVFETYAIGNSIAYLLEAADKATQGDFAGAKQSLSDLKIEFMEVQGFLGEKWGATSFTESLNKAYADQQANTAKAKDDAEQQRIAKGQETRDDEKARNDAEVAEKRYIENVKNSISTIHDYAAAMKELGKERLEFAKSDYTDKLTREFDLYKEGKATVEDLTMTVKKYGVEVNDVFNQRMAGEKDALDRLSALYTQFKESVQINALTKEAKAAGVDILKSYRETAQGIIMVEKDRYKTLLAGEEEYAKKMLATIQEKQKELTKLKQDFTEFNKMLNEEKASATGNFSGGYGYLDPNLDALSKRQAMIDKLRNDEAAALAIPDQTQREAKLQQVIAGWGQLKDQVDIVTTTTKAYADFTKSFSSSGADIPVTTETITTIDTVITKEKALTDAQTEQRRLWEQMMGARQSAIDKDQAAYDSTMKKVSEYRDKLIDLDKILKNLTSTITIDLKVNGMDQIEKIQGFVGQAVKSPFSSSSSGAVDTTDYSDAALKAAVGADTYNSWSQNQPGSGLNYDPSTRTISNYNDIPGLATGGYASPNATYQVNEDGTEYLTMGSKGGYITPAGQTPPGQNAQGAVTIQGDLHFNLPNVTNQTTAKELARQIMPELQQLQQRYRRAA